MPKKDKEKKKEKENEKKEREAKFESKARLKAIKSRAYMQSKPAGGKAGDVVDEDPGRPASSTSATAAAVTTKSTLREMSLTAKGGGETTAQPQQPTPPLQQPPQAEATHAEQRTLYEASVLIGQQRNPTPSSTSAAAAASTTTESVCSTLKQMSLSVVGGGETTTHPPQPQHPTPLLQPTPLADPAEQIGLLQAEIKNLNRKLNHLMEKESLWEKEKQQWEEKEQKWKEERTKLEAEKRLNKLENRELKKSKEDVQDQLEHTNLRLLYARCSIEPRQAQDMAEKQLHGGENWVMGDEMRMNVWRKGYPGERHGTEWRKIIHQCPRFKGLTDATAIAEAIGGVAVKMHSQLNYPHHYLLRKKLTLEQAGIELSYRDDVVVTQKMERYTSELNETHFFLLHAMCTLIGEGPLKVLKFVKKKNKTVVEIARDGDIPNHWVVP